MRTTAEIKAKLGKESIDYIKVGVFDMEGILRGKHIKKEKFFSAMEEELEFCDVVLGLEVQIRSSV